jgi:hypothetical protein
MENFTREGFAAAFLLQTMPLLVQNGADEKTVKKTVQLSVALANALCDELHYSQPDSFGIGELQDPPEE